MAASKHTDNHHRQPDDHQNPPKLDSDEHTTGYASDEQCKAYVLHFPPLGPFYSLVTLDQLYFEQLVKCFPSSCPQISQEPVSIFVGLSSSSHEFL